MRSDPLSFFTVDHGTASTAAALIAPFGGRFRLLAATAGPRGIPVDGLLDDLVRRVVAVAPDALPDADRWPSWARLEVGTHRPPQVVIAATTERIADQLSHTFRAAGWDVGTRIVAGRSDPLAITRACLDHGTTVVAVGAGEPPGSDERRLLDEMVAAIGGVANRRAGLSVLLCGGASAAAGAFPGDRTAAVSGPLGGQSAGGSALHENALILAAEHGASDRASLPDGRRALAVGAASLASLLERPVDVIDIGHSASTRVVASAEGGTDLVVDADAALIPRRAMDTDAEVDAILRWSALRAEPLGMRDRLRNLRIEPWRGMTSDGARLRLAALRAALARLGTGRAQRASDLIVCAGGAFAAVPPPLAALAALDAVRRPGALSIVWDHARLLAPIGTLQSASDRRRLLAELLDDAFLPLAGAVVVSESRPGRHPVLLRLASPVMSTEVWLEPGTLRTVDLPPGVVARADITARDAVLVGVKGKHIVMEVTGGLGGLLVDTREVPLRLPDRAERRRALLESWERPLWPAAAA